MRHRRQANTPNALASEIGPDSKPKAQPQNGAQSLKRPRVQAPKRQYIPAQSGNAERAPQICGSRSASRVEETRRAFFARRVSVALGYEPNETRALKGRDISAARLRARSPSSLDPAFKTQPEAPETCFLSGAAISHPGKHVSRVEARFRRVSDTPVSFSIIRRKPFLSHFSLQIYPADRLFLTHSFYVQRIN